MACANLMSKDTQTLIQFVRFMTCKDLSPYLKWSDISDSDPEDREALGKLINRAFGDPPSGEFQKASKESELEAWQYIAKLCDLTLERYPTTLEEDIELLESDDISSFLGHNKRNCVLLRKGEKEILHFLKQCC